MYWTCIILFCLVYITIIHLLSKGFRGACRCSFWGFSGRLPFVQLLNLSFYFYFDRTCCVTFERDDFIEEACIFRCHPDFYTEPLSRLRWAFVIICGRTTASGTDIQYDKGIISRIFYFKNSCFLFGFRKYAEVYFAVYGFAVVLIRLLSCEVFPVTCFRYKSLTAKLCTGLPITFTLLSLSSRNVWKVISCGNWFNLSNRLSRSMQTGRSKLSRFKIYRNSRSSFDWKTKINGMLLFVAESTWAINSFHFGSCNLQLVQPVEST